jgi:hypothetical protein
MTDRMSFGEEVMEIVDYLVNDFMVGYNGIDGEWLEIFSI